MFFLIYYMNIHDDVIKWKHFTRYWPFVRGIHWSPVNSPHKGQWSRALIFSLICCINGWVNNREAHDLRRHHTHHEVTVMQIQIFQIVEWSSDIILNCKIKCMGYIKMSYFPSEDQHEIQCCYTDNMYEYKHCNGKMLAGFWTLQRHTISCHHTYISRDICDYHSMGLTLASGFVVHTKHVTFECHYNTVKYKKILHTSLQWQGLNMNQRLILNKANPRDLIAAIGRVILLKLDSNRRFWGPCDFEIWWMTPKKI